MAESYDELQWRMLRLFGNSLDDAMEVEAMAWAASEIERLRAGYADIRAAIEEGDSTMHEETLCNIGRIVGAK